MAGREIFKMRVVYKSGYVHDFEVYSFEISGSSYKWTSVDDSNKPFLLNPNDIESIWQVGIRHE